MEHIIISDGEINAVALRTLGYGNDWLQKRLGSVQAEKVFLMTVNEIGDTNILLKEEKR
jgi:hypothetical protein